MHHRAERAITGRWGELTEKIWSGNKSFGSMELEIGSEELRSSSSNFSKYHQNIGGHFGRSEKKLRKREEIKWSSAKMHMEVHGEWRMENCNEMEGMEGENWGWRMGGGMKEWHRNQKQIRAEDGTDSEKRRGRAERSKRSTKDWMTANM